MIKLSIITSTLNAEEGIYKTIHSLLPCPCGVEWVFVDGGSLDNTLSIVSPFVKDLDKKIFRGTSLYGGFNEGANIAKGEYLMWMNSGDTIHSREHLEKLVNVISENNQPDVYYFHAMYNEQLYPVTDINQMPFTFPYTHQACAIKRKTFAAYGGHDVTTGKLADHELAVKMWLTGATFEYIPDLCVLSSAPFTSCEDGIGMCLNDWHNIRNLYQKYRPEKLLNIDFALYTKLIQVAEKGYCDITAEMMAAI